MKKIIFTTMFFSAAMLITTQTKAQFSININIGNQPAWAPEGYDDAQYYYIPDMDVYYDVPDHQFVYQNNRRWIHAATLPASYGRFDLYRVHKVSINQKNAYLNHDRDRKQYAQFRGKYDQQPIRDSHNEKYSNNKNNWQNNRFHNQNQIAKNRQQDGRHDNHNDDHNDRGHR